MSGKVIVSAFLEVLNLLLFCLERVFSHPLFATMKCY